MVLNLSGLITFIEKAAAYFAVGGVGAANVGGLPNSVRIALAAFGALAVIEDRRSAVGVLPPSGASVPPVPPVA